jgi:microcystin-dependent protein
MMKKLSDQISIVTNKYSVGEVRILGTTTLAANEMQCFGQELTIRDYPELYAEIGNTFGAGNGPNTFRLPDFRGIVLAGIDSMGGVSANRLLSLNPRMGTIGGFDRTWLESRDQINPYWYFQNSVQNTGTQIPAGVIAQTYFNPHSDTGITSGSSGNKIYETTVYSEATTNSQPTAALIYAINLGRNKIEYKPVAQPADGPTDLEWAGPFIDYVNVVELYGADPTGTVDSTAAIQRAINDCSYYDSAPVLGGPSDPNTWVRSQTLYLPPGTYLISDSLRIGDSRVGPYPGKRALGFIMCGDDPNTTILKWIGPDNPKASIIWCAGSHDGIVARLGFDGQGTNVIGFRFERDNGVGINQSYDRIQDCTFKDMGCGIANTDDYPGVGTDSEFSILRCRFYRCKNYGVTTYAAEAYDYWIRNCYFEECGKAAGVQVPDGYNNFYPHTYYWGGGGGQFSIYDSVFNASKECDVSGLNGGNIGVRRCVSINSFRFLLTVVSPLASITDNRIIYPVCTDCVNVTSQWGGGGVTRRGPLYFANNEFCMRPDASGPIYYEMYLISQDYDYGFRKNETYTDPRYSAGSFTAYNNRFNVSYLDVWSFDPRLENLVLDTQINQTIDDTLPPLPAQTPKVSRQVFYINPPDIQAPPNPPIQDQINAAVTFAQDNPGSWPVIYSCVHWGQQVVETTEPIEIPANTEIAIQGQGYRSGWGKPFPTQNSIGIPTWLLRGPSKVKFYWMGYNQGKEIGPGRHVVVDNSDQSNARMINDNGQMQLRNYTSNVHCIQTDMYPYNSGYDDMCYSSNWSSTGDGWVLVESAGTGHEAPGGLDPQRYPLIEMQSGSKTFLRDIWHETNGTADIALYTIRGNNAVQNTLFTYQSSREGIYTHKGYAFSVVKFDNVKGQAVISAPTGGVANIIGDGSQFTYTCFNGPPAIDHGYWLTKYNGIDIAPLGQVNTNTDLPGWPNNYNGNTADSYLTFDTGHNWLWDGAQWIDRGGPIGTIASAELLPGWPDMYQSAVPAGQGWHWTGTEWITRPLGDTTGAPIVGDGFFVLDTMTLWLWNGSTWEQHTGMPMPSTYFHYYARRGSGNPPKWFQNYPNGIGGTLPVDYRDTLDLMSSVKPEPYPQPLGNGITDVRFEHCYLNCEMWSTPWQTLSDPSLVASYDSANVQSYPRISSAWFDLNNQHIAFFNGYINFLFDNDGVLEFNGADTYCQINNTAFPSGTDPCTIITWAKPYTVSGSYQWIFTYGSANAHQSRSLGIFGASFIFSGYADDVTGGSLTADTWYQIAGVFDGSNATLYINGANITSQPVAWNTVTDTAQIGRQTNGLEYFNGTISQVQVYNTAFNDSDILSNYNLYKDRYGL